MYVKNKNLIFVFLLSFVLSSTIYCFGFFSSLQEKIYDRLFVQSEEEEKVIIVAIDDVTLEKLGPWPLKRALYGGILKYFEEARSVGLDMFFAEESRFSKEDDLKFVESAKVFPKPIFIPFEIRDRGGVGVDLISGYRDIVQNLSYANVVVDSDGIVRKAEFSRDGYESFACAISLQDCNNQNSFRINYLGKERTILTVSFLDVINSKVPKDLFKDAYVLIGVTSNSLHDVSSTPFGEMPGVEVHANILHTILSSNYFTEVLPVYIYLIFFLVNLFVLYVVVNQKSFLKIFLSLSALFSITQIICVILFNANILLPQLYLGIAFVISVSLLFIMQYLLEGKEKRFIEQTFKYYLMPDVIEDLKKNPEKLKLGGENREVTILFSDIRGFTTISEKLSAEELTRVINEYLTAMTDIIMEEGGLVDKYIGDAIMAFWGAPVDNPKQAECAVRAVVKMSEKLKEMNKEWAKRNVPELGIGIGLNKGQVIVGNMGSSKRFNYTIMGDEVNFGSRLEGLNKMYKTECIVSESVAEAVKGNSEFTLRKLDRVLVKGKKEPKNIYEVITTPVNDNLKKSISAFEHGFEAYSVADWDKAESLIEESLKALRTGPAEVFLDRLKVLKDTPKEAWNGVYEHTSK